MLLLAWLGHPGLALLTGLAAVSLAFFAWRVGASAAPVDRLPQQPAPSRQPGRPHAPGKVPAGAVVTPAPDRTPVAAASGAAGATPTAVVAVTAAAEVGAATDALRQTVWHAQ